MSSERISKKPAFRKLRGYAFDPSLSLALDTVQVNNLTYRIDWEDLKTLPYVYDDDSSSQATTPQNNPTNNGSTTSKKTVPTGEYIQIIDYDPATGVFYPPVDLNDSYILAQDGLDPSVSDPQFHQQMVYAVIMNTIRNFEKALGRRIQWASYQYNEKTKTGSVRRSRFVRRLRVYPHALRQANAYYDPNKKSLLFGYFPAQPANPKLHLPGGTVFTCLSHDIIAHETTHGILDGLHRRYIEDTHPDTRAFHEAFADIVALFQHFTFPEVLKHQIAKTRGDLRAQNLLGELAQEFGKAMGNYSGLRDAIGERDEATGRWKPKEPNPEDYATQMEFHDRGAILVGAVFDAFLSIYRRRISTLLRVYTGGTGVLAEGDLHPDMVNLLAETAADTASRVLRICIRAIDYCPPIDVTFGDYLRAIITGDVDMVTEDERNYRVAFIEAFQKRGIFPAGIKTMSVETLAYEQYPELKLYDSNERAFLEFLRTFKDRVGYVKDRKEIDKKTKEFIAGGIVDKVSTIGIHQRISQMFLQFSPHNRFVELSGMMFQTDPAKCAKEGFQYSKQSNSATYQIENLWLASRITPDDRLVNHVILTLVQKRGYKIACDNDGTFSVKGHFAPSKTGDIPPDGFIFRGGCTLIFDLDQMKLKYAIKKEIGDVVRLEEQYKYVNGLDNPNGASVYFNSRMMSALSGPFAFMHSHSQTPKNI